MRKATVNASFLKEGLRYIKSLLRGRADVQTGAEASPQGIDSNPTQGMIAIYAPTAIDGQSVVVGYLQKERLSKPGELHLFATDANGVEQIRFKLLNDGTAELAGNQDNLVRYSPLNSALSGQAVDINTELAKIAAALAAIGGAYTPAPITLNITAARIEELKSS